MLLCVRPLKSTSILGRKYDTWRPPPQTYARICLIIRGKGEASCYAGCCTRCCAAFLQVEPVSQPYYLFIFFICVSLFPYSSLCLFSFSFSISIYTLITLVSGFSFFIAFGFLFGPGSVFGADTCVFLGWGPPGVIFSP